MIRNVGSVDRWVRFVLAAVLAVVGLLNLSSLWWLIVVAIVPLVTGLSGYCPVWHLFRVKTTKADSP